MSSSSSSSSSSIDPKNGFCSDTKIFHSLRPHVPLPPLSQPHSVTSYCLSLLPTRLLPNSNGRAEAVAALIDSSTSASLSFSDYISQIQSLASSLQNHLHLTKGHVAFVLSPTRIEIPILYFALLSLGVVITPSNPLSSLSEISHQFSLSKPTIAFSVSAYAHKLPTHIKKILVDSDIFQSFLFQKPKPSSSLPVSVIQSHPAAILYSSGTTGRVKGVVLSHRNFIAIVAGNKKDAEDLDHHPVGLFTVPLFHVFGVFMLMRSLALGETTVIMGGSFDFVKMLEAVDTYGVTYMPVSPPLVLAMAKSDVVNRFRLDSLKLVACGGAPLGKEVAEKFTRRFPHVEVAQGYGLTESTGGASGLNGPEETRMYGSAGRIVANAEGKIVDPATGRALGPGQEGELWLRGPTIMTGYIGDNEATVSTLTPDGWLKTGDLGYFDHDGFLFIVDRLKELIKYKAYQVPPAELEHILHSHPEIADAAVIPYPDEAAGEIPMAFVVRQPGSNLNEEQVMGFVAKQVAPYKKIRRVSFVASIPKSAAGKIMRRELVDKVRAKSTSKL